MLGRLIKYDLRSMVRKFAPLWIGLLVLAALNGFTIRHVLDSQRFGWLQFLLGYMPLILFFVMWVTIAVMFLVFICERFYKGLLGDEGYLMLTLPVTTEEHIAAKTLTALILGVATSVIGLLSWALLMVVYQPEWLTIAWEHGREFLTVLGRIPLWLWLELLVLALASTVSQTLHIYAAISIGHLAKKHRAGWAFVAYIGISMAMTTLMSALTPLLSRWPDRWFYYMDQYGPHGEAWVAAAVLGVMILWQVFQSAAFFLGSDYILKNKLNLE